VDDTKINIAEFENRVKTGAIRKFEHPIRTDLIGWCYTEKCQYNKMWDEHTVLARGIITTTEGIVISRPFPKFFNLGEQEAEPIGWSDTIEVTEKLDGSLIVVRFYNGELIVNSKGSFKSEYAEFARTWLMENMSDWVSAGINGSDNGKYTYLFEAIFPPTNKNEVKVINYGDKRDLTLLAIIEIQTGSEYTYEQLQAFARQHTIPLAPRYEFDDINAIITLCKTRATVNDGEGLVLHFRESGKRIKVKSDIYIRLHRLISHANRKTVLEMLAKGDDIETIYAPLPDELYQDVKKWIKEFTDEYTEIQNRVNTELPGLLKIPDRKEQAKYIYQNPELAEIKGLLFMSIDGNDITSGIWGILKKRMKAKLEDKPIVIAWVKGSGKPPDLSVGMNRNHL
jgi:T4 RnlA family RNA ligase